MQDYVRQARARRAAGSPMPPVTLKVAFENRGKEPCIMAYVLLATEGAKTTGWDH